MDNSNSTNNNINIINNDSTENQSNSNSSNLRTTCASDMKYACGLCDPFLEGSEELSAVDDKDRNVTMISDINDIVKVESLVASPSKLDCIVEEKKEEECEPEMDDTREERIETENTTEITDVVNNISTNDPKNAPEEAQVSQSETAPATTIDDVTEPLVTNVVEETIAESTLECDFDKNPTDLYLALMRKDWSGVIRRCVQYPDEAKTWIYRKEASGAIRWKLLPIHAGIIFNAPVPVIDALLHAHLYGADCKDDQGMVPLHLAIRMNSDHTIVEKLVSARPNSVKAQDRKGRTPRALAEKQATCPQKLLVIQTLDNVNTTTTMLSPQNQERSLPTPSASRHVTIDASTVSTPKVEVAAVEKVLRGEEAEIQLEKVSRENMTIQNKFKQQIEVLEKNAKRDAETIRTLQETIRTTQESESELQLKVTELETILQSTLTEKNNLEDSNKAVIVNLVSQVGAIQAKLTDMTNEKDSIASTLAEVEESSKQEIAQRKLRCLELERQLGQVTFMKEEVVEALSKSEKTVIAQKGHINLLKDDISKIQAKLTETETKLEEVTVSEQELAWQNHALSVTGQMYAKNNGNDVAGRSEYQNQIKSLEKERDELRETVNKLSVKLYKVVGFLDEMVQEQEAIINETLTRDGEMIVPNTVITNADGTTTTTTTTTSAPAAISDDRIKLLSNVSGMKEQIIGVIDSVIEGMPQEIEDDVVNQVTTTLGRDVDEPTVPVILP
jgi:hypothetical protein